MTSRSGTISPELQLTGGRYSALRTVKSRKGTEANMALTGVLPRLGLFRVTGVRYCSGFRSAYSLDKLYPDSTRRTAEENTKDYRDIPVVNTKAEVRFQLSSAEWIPEDVRQKISVQNKNRINRNGELIVVSEISRYQMRNLADCLDKIRIMISQADQKPKVETKEDIELRKNRLEKMNRERLRQKKLNSSIKQSRSVSME
ncbi:peptidyl-tRNA hydrolase ICT1, mitochondrial isoform X2 [Rana temporaria]|uniref:peptidyl-tRNA hydrolase ICT1, mitochondrial isoform X2 n=1 Tax=Rana temporaria TaxID=8407 RepID=UPI001AADEF32|nr:peptidyl-tRNA hydrolase ICT1, mitochondrial isoform X2 [Rana temporaria]